MRYKSTKKHRHYWLIALLLANERVDCVIIAATTQLTSCILAWIDVCL